MGKEVGWIREEARRACRRLLTSAILGAMEVFGLWWWCWRWRKRSEPLLWEGQELQNGGRGAWCLGSPSIGSCKM